MQGGSNESFVVNWLIYFSHKENVRFRALTPTRTAGCVPSHLILEGDCPLSDVPLYRGIASKTLLTIDNNFVSAQALTPENKLCVFARIESHHGGKKKALPNSNSRRIACWEDLSRRVLHFFTTSGMLCNSFLCEWDRTENVFTLMKVDNIN